MQISPVYDRALLTFDGGPPVGPAMVRQRRRLLALLRGLTRRAVGRTDPLRRLDRARRCRTSRRASTASGTHRSSPGSRAQPTRYLPGFDPKTVPAAMVDAARGKPPAETLAEIDRTSSALCDLVEDLPDSAWSMLAESPAGHVSVAAVVQHALWDAWVHERDVVIPLGLTPVEEDDEVLASLQYAAAVNAGFGLMAGIAVPATLLLEVTDPIARIAVTVDDTVHTTAVAGDVPADAVVLSGSSRRPHGDAQHAPPARPTRPGGEAVVGVGSRRDVRGRVTTSTVSS